MVCMSHPDPKGPPDHTLIKAGEIWENPVNRERLTILERPWDNPEGRVTFEMTALVAARVVGEHRHPSIVERFTVIEGELTVKRNQTIRNFARDSWGLGHCSFSSSSALTTIFAMR